MASMNPAELSSLTAALEDRQRELSEQLNVTSEAKQREIDRYHDAGQHDQGEESAEEQVMDNATAVIGHLRAELADVRAALKRVESGEYGQCLDCGIDIPLPRLKAQLHASRCVDCQSRLDS